ncbi:MAG: SulP family inorganic anion transporter, partial [Gemmatimonadota bacterium]|nr:SulP family inorganic anion transporter [Gemmatimonadota bacterium]
MPPESSTRFSAGDLTGGFASAVVSIPGNVAAGVIAFAPLGAEYAGFGILAGMLSSIVAGLLASLFGGAPGMIAGPKATTSMAFAAMLTSLLATIDIATPDGERLLLSLAFGAVLLSGTVQIVLGAFRVGGLVKFMPYPVVAGIRNTTAILLISSQIWPSLGVTRQSWGSLLAELGQIQPATLTVAVFTALFVSKGGRILRKPAVPIVALVVGSGLYHLIAAVLPGARLGPVLGALPPVVPRPEYAVSVFTALGESMSLGVVGAVVAGALAIAVLDSISALISLVSYQSIADRRFDANHQLVGQGLGSAVSALFGGLTTSGILARAVVNHRAGGRTKASGVVNALGVLALMFALTRPLAMLPKAAIAGLIMVIASGLFDRWSFGQVKESLRADAKDRRDNLIASFQMIFVVFVGLTWSLVAAVGAGVVLSVVVFVVQMSR